MSAAINLPAPRTLSEMLAYLAAEAERGRAIDATVLRLCAERAREHEEAAVVDLRPLLAARATMHSDHLHGDGGAA